MFRALEKLRGKWAEQDLLAPFDGLVTPEMLLLLRGMLPSPSSYTLHAEEFAHGSFPFGAYNKKVEETTIPTTGGNSHG